MEHAAHESSGPGGTLHWSERSDRHWTARGLGGYFDASPTRSGYHLYFMNATGGYEDLGAHATLGGIFSAARRYADEAAGQKAAENPVGGCAHAHPPEVPTAPCGDPPASGGVVIEKLEVASATTAVALEETSEHGMTWHTYAGGTGAAAGKQSYDARGAFGEYHIWPPSALHPRAGYRLQWANTQRMKAPHGGLWHDLGSFRSPAAAKAAAKKHADALQPMASEAARKRPKAKRAKRAR